MTWHERLISMVSSRPADFIIGGKDNPYMHRWWIIPRNRFFNVYLHHIVRDDDDRALHDHPWISFTVVLRGGYWDVTPGGKRKWLGHWDKKFRWATDTHRIELSQGESAWTLFITGPRVRDWGFHCPKGWRHWKEFCAIGDSGRVGKGCD